jgi:hypothetical protein
MAGTHFNGRGVEWVYHPSTLDDPLKGLEVVISER